jgi:hypothetical protein
LRLVTIISKIIFIKHSVFLECSRWLSFAKYQINPPLPLWSYDWMVSELENLWKARKG